MAEIAPFQPYRYTSPAGNLENLLTQPYDKISPEMQARYHAASPHNYAHLILGERHQTESETDNVYTRAAASLERWILDGILARDPEPGFYPYFQEFTVPDTGERVTRKGYIGLGPLADYSENVVYRHEQTLRGPKQDRLDLMRATQAHTGQLFFLYRDPEHAVDRILEEAAREEPLVEVRDEFDVVHRMWRISDTERTGEITRLMADKKLLIADGHHRYETALAFHRENPEIDAARHVMLTLVNMSSPGLKILATHRLLHGLAGFEASAFLKRAGSRFTTRDVSSTEELQSLLAGSGPATVRIGVAAAGGARLAVLEKERKAGELDVSVLHDVVLDQLLGIDAEAVREQTHTRYMRGLEAAVAAVRAGDAQAAFLLEPTSVDQVAGVSFSGGVMPQKSTDFYPKLLAGLTTYRF